ncbi:GNAT family N-acetyltransferase [Pelagibacterales bacterium SAG-MED47]|nr:GNAT family N-acetyltransferase [Pelagibacterales bacterium SAG-MED47]
MSELEFKIRDSFTKELENEWLDLSKLSEVSIFQNFSWQHCWFENINKKEAKNSLFIISIYFKKKIIGILPFEKKKYLNLNILGLTGAPFADYCDFIIDSKFLKSNDNIKKLIREFVFNIEGIDLVIFDKVKESSNLHILFDNLTLNQRNYNSYQLKKENGNNNLIPKKFLSDTNRQIKKLNLRGTISYKIASTTLEKERVLEFFLTNKAKQLEITKSWNYLKKEIYKNFLIKMFELNDAHLSFLSLNDKIIAVHLGYLKENKLIYLFPTYDREYANFSPGNILIIKMINNFFKNNGLEFDFTTGDENYKIRLSNRKQRIFYKIISLNFKSNFVKVLIELFNYIKQIKYLRLVIQKINHL